MRSGNIIWAVLVIGLAAGFFFGRWKGRGEVNETFVNNPELVKEIAELAVLEVDGNAKFTESNSSLSKNFWDDLGDFLGEKTLSVEIPYVAKYGVDLAKSDIRIKAKGKKEVQITLEKPALKSFELRMDRLQQQTKNGVFIFQKDDKLKVPMQKLYTETKKKLAENRDNIKLAQEKVESQLKKYFAALEITADINWTK